MINAEIFDIETYTPKKYRGNNIRYDKQEVFQIAYKLKGYEDYNRPIKVLQGEESKICKEFLKILEKESCRCAIFGGHGNDKFFLKGFNILKFDILAIMIGLARCGYKFSELCNRIYGSNIYLDDIYLKLVAIKRTYIGRLEDTIIGLYEAGEIEWKYPAACVHNHEDIWEMYENGEWRKLEEIGIADVTAVDELEKWLVFKRSVI